MEWHYTSGGERKGPVTEDQIRILLENGNLDHSTHVWNINLPDWQPITSSSLSVLLRNSPPSPPPIPGNTVKNELVWILSVCPIAGGILTALLAPLLNMEGGLFWLTPALNIWLAYWDEKRLTKTGYATSQMGGAWLIPVYLWKRATVLKQSRRYFFLWCVAFIFSILFL